MYTVMCSANFADMLVVPRIMRRLPTRDKLRDDVVFFTVGDGMAYVIQGIVGEYSIIGLPPSLPVVGPPLGGIGHAAGHAFFARRGRAHHDLEVSMLDHRPLDPETVRSTSSGAYLAEPIFKEGEFYTAPLLADVPFMDDNVECETGWDREPCPDPLGETGNPVAPGGPSGHRAEVPRGPRHVSGAVDIKQCSARHDVVALDAWLLKAKGGKIILLKAMMLPTMSMRAASTETATHLDTRRRAKTGNPVGGVALRHIGGRWSTLRLYKELFMQHGLGHHTRGVHGRGNGYNAAKMLCDIVPVTRSPVRPGTRPDGLAEEHGPSRMSSTCMPPHPDVGYDSYLLHKDAETWTVAPVNANGPTSLSSHRRDHYTTLIEAVKVVVVNRGAKGANDTGGVFIDCTKHIWGPYKNLFYVSWRTSTSQWA